MLRYLILGFSLAVAPCTAASGVNSNPIPAPTPDPDPGPIIIEPADVRCSTLAQPAIDQAGFWGYRVDCSPGSGITQPAAPPGGPRPYGWADHARQMIWMWPDGHLDSGVRATLWHEVGHIRQQRIGFVGDQNAREADADAFAYCHLTPEQRNGVGFLLKPADCRPWL